MRLEHGAFRTLAKLIAMTAKNHPPCVIPNVLRLVCVFPQKRNPYPSKSLFSSTLCFPLTENDFMHHVIIAYTHWIFRTTSNVQIWVRVSQLPSIYIASEVFLQASLASDDQNRKTPLCILVAMQGHNRKP
jgi:hypothetical protein